MAIPRFISAPIGRTAQIVGRTYDYLTPDEGSSVLTNAGRAITDKNVTFQSANLGTGYSAFQPTNNPYVYNPTAGSSSGTQTKQNTDQNNGDNTPIPGDSTYGGYGTSGTDAAQQREIELTRAQLDSKEGALRGLLGQYGAARETGLRTIGENYDTSLTQGNKDYDAQRVANDLNRQKAYGQVDTKARTDWSSLRRMLSGTGAANESAGMAARMAVARQSSADRDAQTQTFGQNDQGIANAQAKYIQGLQREKAQKEEALLRSLLESENDVNSQLGDVSMQRSYLNGDNYQAIRDAANSYQAKIDANNAKLNTLPDQFRSAYTTVIDPAKLSDFTVDPTAIDAQNQGAGKEYSPFSSLLRKKILEQA